VAYLIDVKSAPYNAVGDGISDDTTKLQAAFNDGITYNLSVFVPAGTYRTTANISVVGNNVMIYGAGGVLSKIKPDDYTYDCLTIGVGASGSGSYPSGYLKDISIEGNSSWITGFTAGLKLDGMRQFEVKNVNVSRMPIGFDLINNCYGSTFMNCRTNLGGLSLNLRTGPQSGSDITFYNCWFRGKNGAVNVSPDAGGFHFYGGQLTGGDLQGADNDNIGVITLGKDYINGTLGSIANINFDGIDFEGSKYIWQVRSYGQSNLTISNCAFLSTSNSSIAEKPLGIIKATNALQSRITLLNNSVAGVWKAIKAIDVTGQGSVLSIHEIGTAMINGGATFNGISNPDTAGLLEQSKNNMGSCFFRSSSLSKLILGNMMIRSSTTSKYEISFDWGVTWVALQQTLSGATGSRPTANTYVGQFYFDTTLNKPIYRNALNSGWIDSTGATV
jgi:hypothetical protein